MASPGAYLCAPRLRDAPDVTRRDVAALTFPILKRAQYQIFQCLTTPPELAISFLTSTVGIALHSGTEFYSVMSCLKHSLCAPPP